MARRPPAVPRATPSASTSSRCAGGGSKCCERVLTARTGRTARGESGSMAATQDALYAELDLELSWSERELPERERTKHVHRLHPYLGKFIPQLVEELLRRHVAAGGRVLDPFAGSGTTLVQALESGHERDRGRPRGVQLPADAGQDGPLQPLHARARPARRARAGSSAARARPAPRPGTSPSGSRRRRPTTCCASARWSATTSTPTSCAIVLARAARSARLTTHFDLDFPRAPAARAVLVPQAQARVPAGRARRRTSCAATRSTRSRG